LKSSDVNGSVSTDVKISNSNMVAFYDTQDNNNNYSSQAERNPLFDQKLDIATEGLEPYYLEHLKTRLSKENALTIANYILSMKVETNLSVNHKRGIITSLKLLSEFLGSKPFKKMTREDIVLFLDVFRCYTYINNYVLFAVSKAVLNLKRQKKKVSTKQPK
jgi:hypothetical protein